MTSHASTIEAPAAGRTWAHLHLPRLRAGEIDCISVKVPGERIDYTSAIGLTDVTFYVSEAGRQRCLNEGVRNVHAWCVGVAGPLLGSVIVGGRRALYCPFKGSTFVDADTLEPIYTASAVAMIGKDVYYTP